MREKSGQVGSVGVSRTSQARHLFGLVTPLSVVARLHQANETGGQGMWITGERKSANPACARKFRRRPSVLELAGSSLVTRNSNRCTGPWFWARPGTRALAGENQLSASVPLTQKRSGSRSDVYQRVCG